MTESEKKFPVTKDPFHTSPKTLENLEDESIWRTIAQDYFNESAEEINSKVQILKEKILELDLKLPRQDDLFLLKFLRAGGGDLEVALKVVQCGQLVRSAFCPKKIYLSSGLTLHLGCSL